MTDDRWDTVARLLKSEPPMSNRAVAAQAHVGTRFVRQVRADLGLAPFVRHRRVWTVEEFERQTILIRGGHRLWRGRRSVNGSPIHGHTGRTVYRLSFRLHHGREPVGRVSRSCTRKFCVEGSHQHDEKLRDQAAAALLTELPAGTTWRGMDLVAIRRALHGEAPPYPSLDEDERRFAARFAPVEMTTEELSRRLGCCSRSAKKWREEGVPSCG